MSSEPPGLTSLKNYVASKLGWGNFLGIVGDQSHTYGYHLGPDRTPYGDASESLSRDRDGASRYPYYASAIDIGMGWNNSRQWLANLINDCREYKPYTRDIREIIGSLNGSTAVYWNGANGFSSSSYTGGGHVTHTHLSFYRDSADRNQTSVLQTFLEPPVEEDDDMPTLLPIDLHGMEVGESRTFPTIPVNSGGLPWGPAYLSVACNYGNAKLLVAYQKDGENWWRPFFGESWDESGLVRWIRSDQPRNDHSYELKQHTGKLTFELVEVETENPQKFSLNALIEIGNR